jgi:hypothetical protein
MSRMAALLSKTASRRKAPAISLQVSGHECNRRDARVNLYAVSPIVAEDSSPGDRCGEPASFPTRVKVMGSVPFSVKTDEGGLWNTERGILGKEVGVSR